MKLPKEMPEELKTAIHEQTIKYGKLNFLAELPPIDVIYKVFKDHFDNKLIVDWRPVSEKPEDEGQIVWVTDGDFVEIASYSSSIGFLASILLDSNITHWTYVESKKPEPPKEII